MYASPVRARGGNFGDGRQRISVGALCAARPAMFSSVGLRAGAGRARKFREATLDPPCEGRAARSHKFGGSGRIRTYYGFKEPRDHVCTLRRSGRASPRPGGDADRKSKNSLSQLDDGRAPRKSAKPFHNGALPLSYGSTSAPDGNRTRNLPLTRCSVYASRVRARGRASLVLTRRRPPGG